MNIEWHYGFLFSILLQVEADTIKTKKKTGTNVYVGVIGGKGKGLGISLQLFLVRHNVIFFNATHCCPIVRTLMSAWPRCRAAPLPRWRRCGTDRWTRASRWSRRIWWCPRRFLETSKIADNGYTRRNGS